MLGNPTSEPPHRQALRDVSALLTKLEERAEVLMLHGSDGIHRPIPMGAAWSAVPHAPDARVFHVPAPDGVPGLFVVLAATEFDTAATTAHTDQSRLIAVMAGEMNCNGKCYTAGQTFWLAAGEPARIHAAAGTLMIVLFGAPLPITVQL